MAINIQNDFGNMTNLTSILFCHMNCTEGTKKMEQHLRWNYYFKAGATQLLEGDGLPLTIQMQSERQPECTVFIAPELYLYLQGFLLCYCGTVPGARNTFFVFLKIRWLSLKGPNSTALQRALLHRNRCFCVNLTVFFNERILIHRMRASCLISLYPLKFSFASLILCRVLSEAFHIV